MIKERPHAWQKDPDMIMTETVQLWRHGIMMTASIPRERAKEMVRKGEAFVITSQAIGGLTKEGYYNA